MQKPLDPAESLQHLVTPPEFNVSLFASEPDIIKPIWLAFDERGEATNLDDEVVLIGAGELILVPGRADRIYFFRSHSEYFYLTDRERPGGVLAFDPHGSMISGTDADAVKHVAGRRSSCIHSAQQLARSPAWRSAFVHNKRN